MVVSLSSRRITKQLVVVDRCVGSVAEARLPAIKTPITSVLVLASLAPRTMALVVLDAELLWLLGREGPIPGLMTLRVGRFNLLRRRLQNRLGNR